MDYDIQRAKELIAQREEIDAELADIFSGSQPRSVTRKAQKCSRCGSGDHNARNCDKQQELPTT